MPAIRRNWSYLKDNLMGTLEAMDGDLPAKEKGTSPSSAGPTLSEYVIISVQTFIQEEALKEENQNPEDVVAEFHEQFPEVTEPLVTYYHASAYYTSDNTKALLKGPPRLTSGSLYITQTALFFRSEEWKVAIPFRDIRNLEKVRRK